VQKLVTFLVYLLKINYSEKYVGSVKVPPFMFIHCVKFFFKLLNQSLFKNGLKILPTAKLLEFSSYSGFLLHARK